MVRIRICGGAGSGKTTLAKKLSQKYRIPHYNMDDIYFTDEKDYAKLRDEKEREKLLQKILKQKNWILEGTYTREWAVPTFKQADKVVYVDSPVIVRQYRLIRRWIHGKRGRSTHKPSTFLQMLELLHYEIGHKKRHISRIEKMKLGKKLVVIRKIEEYT